MMVFLFFGMAGSMSHPSLYWQLLGWWKGEAFYQARPTTYWRHVIQQSYQQLIWSTEELPLDGYYSQHPTCCQRWISRIFGATDCATVNTLPIDDKAALAVWTELLSDDDEVVRRVAAYRLMKLGSVGQVAIPALQRTLSNAKTEEERTDIKRVIHGIACE